MGLLLTLLLDPGDGIATLAVLKMPAVGLTDLAILRLREWGFGRLFSRAEAPALEPGDAAALERLREGLRQARERLARESTADVLERLVTHLDWRPVLGAGPDGIAELARLVESERVAHSHALNDRSSRSHCLVHLHLMERSGASMVRRQLLFVDLAGSECNKV